jgi:hypothetical protein
VLPTLAHAVRGRQAQTLRCWSAGTRTGHTWHVITRASSRPWVVR